MDESLYFTEQNQQVREMVRGFARSEVARVAARHDEDSTFPWENIRKMGELGLLGVPWPEELEGAGLDLMSYILTIYEMARVDASHAITISAHTTLGTSPIVHFGTDEQRRRFVPHLASGRVLGGFGLTEPDAGSDPAAMKTRARKTDGGYVLNGTKMWITSSPVCHLAVVWAKVDGDDPNSIRGFIVDRGTKGFETPTVHGKMSLRASPTGEIVLSDAFVPEENVLPGVAGLKGALACLTQARFGIAFGALGAARACFDAVLSYSRERIAFGGPIARKQLVQKKIVDMAAEIAKGKIMVMHYARLKEKGDLLPAQVSLCKKNNVGIALEIARSARSVLGANGILLEYPVVRHMLNLESVFTYEGTDEVHTLILGAALTGENAF